MVLFANHSLLKDPPFSRIDLISCRNLLIYLDRDLQEQVCNTFHYALNPDGFLMLGSSESADNPAGLFRTVDRKARIYQSIGTPGELRLLPRLLGSVASLHEQAAHRRSGRRRTTAMLNEAASHRQALEKLAPPSILVDRVASGPAPVRQCRPVSAAVRRSAERQCRRSGAAGTAVRTALGAAPRLRNLATLAQPADPGPLQRRAASRADARASRRTTTTIGEPRNAVVLFIEGGAVDLAAEAPLVRRTTPPNEIVAPAARRARSRRRRGCGRRGRNRRAPTRNCARPTKSCNRSTRNTARPPRSWRPARKSCSRSTRSCRPSTASSS